MKNTIKELIISIVFIVLFISNVICNPRVAIVGNSQAYYMAKAVNVDDNVNNICRTNNAVGGTFIWSPDIEISTFPYRAHNYDDCILFFGTNELLNNFTFKDYFDYFVYFTKEIHYNNPEMIIKVIEIPKVKGYKQYDDIIKGWNYLLNLYIEQVEYLDYVKIPNNPTFKDYIHLDDNTLIKIYNNALGGKNNV